jgi:hypothetical protein
MYEVFWSNISRAEDTAWKMMASYTALFAGLSLAITYITVFGFVSIIIVFSFLAVAICLNANLWFVRNIGIISSIEKEMLLESDLDKIIPKSWVERKLPYFSWGAIEIWWVFVPVFVIVPLITLALSYHLLNSCEQIATDALFVGDLVLTAAYGIGLRGRHLKYLKRVSGSKQANQTTPAVKPTAP